MDANGRELIYKEEVFQIVGCAMEVLNELGHGLLEKPYKNALAHEFSLRGMPYQQQVRYPVVYKSVKVGEYIPDLVVFDTKTIDHITNIEKGQVLNYLKITGLKVGLILNFKNPKLGWERVVLDKQR